MAAQFSQDAGIAYRYGASGTGSNVPTWPKLADNALPASYNNGGTKSYWQIGGPMDSSVNDYSTNVAQAAFVADNPAVHLGVADLETLAMRENTFTQSPGLTWTYAGVPGGGLNEVNALAYKAAGKDASAPTALGRCYGRPSWCVNSIMAFQNGLLGTAGSNTAGSQNTAQLDAGNVPTAVAVTNSGEFALVTVWDTANVRGRVAVVALSEKGTRNWGGAARPGLPNFGNWGFMKIIGYVDLPGMAAPTDISVTTGVHTESMHRLFTSAGQDFITSDDIDLSNESLRQTFAPGGVNTDSFAQAGVAVVTSKSERKVSFIDLKPLFAYYRSMYFGSRSNFDKTATVGQGASQWPYAFSAAASQVPTVIKTVALANRPTAVKVNVSGGVNRAWIATEDGTLHFYSLGDYAFGGNASPDAIRETGSVAVGKNPTHIAYWKQDATKPEQGTDAINTGVIVVSRGERKIDWVNFSPDNNGGSILRTLRDSRLVDPVSAEDNDNHGTESHLLTVADYSGKQIANYRYGPVVYHTNRSGTCAPPSGCGMAGQFQFGGALALPGKAFQVTGANVP